MKRLTFSTDINAPKDKVWKSLWEDQNYRDWTSAFCEGSYLKGDLKAGGRVHFLDPEGNGMYSDIGGFEDGTYISFEHQGELKKGEEQPQDEKTKEWAGAQENYRLTETENGTRVDVDVDVTEPHINYFNEAFPKGMAKLKEIAES